MRLYGFRRPMAAEKTPRHMNMCAWHRLYIHKVYQLNYMNSTFSLSFSMHMITVQFKGRYILCNNSTTIVSGATTTVILGNTWRINGSFVEHSYDTANSNEMIQ